MKIVNIGSFNCEYCKKGVLVRVYANNPEAVLDHKNEAIRAGKNFHWYDHHYNCAVCGEWIPSGERELVFERDFILPIHSKYNITPREGLLRVHKNCVAELKNEK
jgi:hypothetical protein